MYEQIDPTNTPCPRCGNALRARRWWYWRTERETWDATEEPRPQCQQCGFASRAWRFPDHARIIVVGPRG